MSPPIPLIRFEHISRTYAMGEVSVHALRDVNLDIPPGEMTAIMGASGSGKSTMLNLLGTLDRPTSGSYYLDGEAVERLDEYALAALRNRKIGFVFQSFNLLPRDTALANVELPMVYAGVRPAERRRRALEALEWVGLGDRVHHVPNQLSGGQQQRVSIARAIVNQPRLVLADEPTGALDSTTSVQVMGMFRELHRQGITVVVVTHDAAVAEWAERVVSFRDGQVVGDERHTPSERPGPPPSTAAAPAAGGAA